MATSSEYQRIEFLIFIECGNKTRTQQQRCNLFNAKYPSKRISRSDLSKTEKNLDKIMQNAGLPNLSENLKLDVVYSFADKGIFYRSVLLVLKHEKYYP